jgi:hypothetical protein
MNPDKAKCKLLIQFGISSVLLLIVIIISIKEASADEYQNIYNNTGLNEVNKTAINSNHDSIFVFSHNSISEWGLSNQTRISYYDIYGANPIDLDWNDNYKWMAYAHIPDYMKLMHLNKIWMSELLIFNYSGYVVAGIEPFGNLTSNENRTIIDLEWHPSLPLLAVAFGDGHIKIYDIEREILVSEYHFQNPIIQLRWNNLGTMLAVLAGNMERAQDIVIWATDENDTTEIDTKGLSSIVTDIRWLFDDGHLLLLLTNGDILAYNMSSLAFETVWQRNVIAIYPAHTIPIIAIIMERTVIFYDFVNTESDHHVFQFAQSSLGGWTDDDAFMCTVDQVGIIRVWSRIPFLESPSIGIIFPTEDLEVSGKVIIEGWARSASENNGSIYVKIGLEDWQLGSGFLNWYYALNSTSHENGPIMIRARALDPSGFSSIAVCRIVINNSNTKLNTPPVLIVYEPKSGSRVFNNLLLNGLATDDNLVESIQYRVESDNWRTLPIDNTGKSVEWRDVIHIYQYGPTEIRVRAFDGTLFSEIVTISIEIVIPEQENNNLTIAIDYPEPNSEIPQNFTILGHSNGSPDSIFITMDDIQAFWIPGGRTWKYGLMNVSRGYHVLKAIGQKDGIFSPWIIVHFQVNWSKAINLNPIVKIEYPPPDTVLLSDFQVTGWSVDDVIVKKVEMRLNNGTWLDVVGTSNWTHNINIDGIEPGWLSVEVRAYDGELFSEPDARRYYLGTNNPKVRTSNNENYSIILLLIVIILLLCIYIIVRSRMRGNLISNGDLIVLFPFLLYKSRN